MTREEHIQRHEELHRAFDELLADWITHNPEVRPSVSTVFELMQWSYLQTKEPSLIDGEHK